MWARYSDSQMIIFFESSVASVRAETTRKEEKKEDLRETSPLTAEIGQPRNNMALVFRLSSL
jgi:hypothetical protein